MNTRSLRMNQGIRTLMLAISEIQFGWVFSCEHLTNLPNKMILNPIKRRGNILRSPMLVTGNERRLQSTPQNGHQWKAETWPQVDIVGWLVLAEYYLNLNSRSADTSLMGRARNDSGNGDVREGSLYLKKMRPSPALNSTFTLTWTKIPQSKFRWGAAANLYYSDKKFTNGEIVAYNCQFAYYSLKN